LTNQINTRDSINLSDRDLDLPITASGTDRTQQSNAQDQSLCHDKISQL